MSFVLVAAAVTVLAAEQQLPPRDTPRPPAPATATVQGRVVADDTGGPIRDCQIDLWLESVRVYHSTRTDAEGRFEIVNLSPGKYRLSARPTATHAGYVPYEGVRSAPIELVAGQKHDAITIRLLRGAAINGRVLDQHAEPVGGIEIFVFRRDPIGGLISATPWRLLQTDDLGRFRVSRLEAGSYVLAAEPAITRLPEQAPDRTQFQRTFYPSVSDAAEAAVLSLATGQEADGIDIRLRRERTFIISGVVFDARGLPAGQAGAVGGSIMRSSGSGYVHTNLDLGVKSDGSFTTASLPPGTYSLRAEYRAGSGANAAWEYGSLKVVVADADVEGLSLTLRSAATVIGTVLLDPDGSAGAPPGLRMFARPHPAETGFADQRMGAEVGRNGTFTLTTLVGPVLVRPVAPEGWFLKAVMRGEDDITEKPTEFKTGANERIQVIMTRSASEVAGRVTGDEGVSAGRATVYVFAQDSALWHWIFTTSRTAPALEGQYIVRGLRPGRYFAVALAAEASFDRGPSAYDVLSRHAVPFELRDGERRTLDLPLTVIKQR